MSIHTDLTFNANYAMRKLSEGYAAFKQLREVIEKIIKDKFPEVKLSVRSSTDELQFIIVDIEMFKGINTDEIEAFVEDINKDMPDFVLHPRFFQPR